MVRFGSRGSRVRITPPRALFVLFDVDEFEALDLRRPARGKAGVVDGYGYKHLLPERTGRAGRAFWSRPTKPRNWRVRNILGDWGSRVQISPLRPIAPINTNTYKAEESGIGRLELGISQLSGCQNMPAAGSGWNENAAPRGQTGEQLRVTRKGFNWAVRSQLGSFEGSDCGCG